MLKLENTHVNFNGNNIISNLSIEIKTGEFVVIVGKNGCGKSTLLKVISGEITPSKGRIWIDNSDYTRVSQEKRANLISTVVQNPSHGVWDNLTIEENLIIAFNKCRPNALSIYSKKEIKNLISEKIKILGIGLDDRLNSYPSELSGGQKQGLSLIMSTIKPLKILLLDEHTSAIDYKFEKFVMSLSNSIISEQNLTAIMVTHNLEDAILYGSRLIIMNHGVIYKDIQKNLNPISNVELKELMLEL